MRKKRKEEKGCGCDMDELHMTANYEKRQETKANNDKIERRE